MTTLEYGYNEAVRIRYREKQNGEEWVELPADNPVIALPSLPEDNSIGNTSYRSGGKMAR